MRERDLQQAGGVPGVLRHHDRAAANEDQRESADELGDEVFSHGRTEVGGRESKGDRPLSYASWTATATAFWLRTDR